jgi:16S rRNA (adenine1518-N6/adenine1519-N6)-dimethyltransferase
MNRIDPRKDLKALEINPKQTLGQNFCIDENILAKIAQAGQPFEDSPVIEVGPGTGALTRHLIEQAGKVIAIETDPRMEPLLRDKFGESIDLRIADALTELPKVLEDLDKAIVIGNLPYNISSQILIACLNNRRKVQRGVFTLQDEMADRVAASPGSKAYGSLTVRLAQASRVSKLFKIGPNSFFPAPKVSSACICIEFPENPDFVPEDEATFKKTVRAAFAQRRKQLKNTLATAFDKSLVEQALRQAEIPISERAEQLSVEDFVRLADTIFRMTAR